MSEDRVAPRTAELREALLAVIDHRRDTWRPAAAERFIELHGADLLSFIDEAEAASLDSDELRKAVERLVQTVQADHDSERTGVCHDPASALALREVRALLSAGDKADHRMGPPAWEPGLRQDEWANRCVTCHELWPCAGDKAKAPRHD